IQEDIAKAILPANTADTAALARARAMFAQLRTGNLDRSLMTDDSNYYFTDLTLSDYKASLMPLGKPVSFTQTGKTRLRGGFVNRNYKMRLGKKDFVITTYAEPGDKGRYEQFLVAPAVS
ncbi:MAG: serine hydrolase, partial [Sphingomonas bacterium]